MSGIKAAWIECDDCEVKYPSHLGLTTISEARRLAAREGWRSRLGKDWCPECKKKHGY